MIRFWNSSLESFLKPSVLLFLILLAIDSHTSLPHGIHHLRWRCLVFPRWWDSRMREVLTLFKRTAVLSRTREQEREKRWRGKNKIRRKGLVSILSSISKPDLLPGKIDNLHLFAGLSRWKFRSIREHSTPVESADRNQAGHKILIV